MLCQTGILYFGSPGMLINMTPFRQILITSHVDQKILYTDFINYTIRLEVGLEIRHGGVMRVCVIEDKTAIVIAASYHSVSRNSVRFEPQEYTEWTLRHFSLNVF